MPDPKPRSAAKPKPATEPQKVERRPIERTSAATGAWWCPFCDTSHESKVGACQCGARRDGDDAVKP